MKKLSAAHLESACATLRMVLEWYAQGGNDKGERARMALSVSDGAELLKRLRDATEAAANLGRRAVGLEERLREAEHGEGQEVSAWRATAVRYERCFRNYQGWVKFHYATNDLADATQVHSRRATELALLRFRSSQPPAARPATLLARLDALQAEGKVERGPRSVKSVINATARLRKDGKHWLLELIHPGPIESAS